MQFIKYHSKDRKGYITLNRPEKRNALHPGLISELKTVLTDIENDKAIKVVIVQAEGKVFSAGADLSYLQELQTNTYEENLADSDHLKELFIQLYVFPKPVIAKVQGHAIAGGCGLATVCDFVYAVPEAKFGYTEVKIGFIPAMVLVFLIRKIGEARASELLLSAELVEAVRAAQLGLIHQVVEADFLDLEVEKLADRLIEGNSSQSMTLTKRLIKRVQDLSFDESMKLASEANAKARGSEDCKKGIAAFLEKKKITW